MPPKLAKLTCPDCNATATWRQGVRCCPDCGDELLLSETGQFQREPIDAKGTWMYNQRRGQDKGGVQWR